MAEPIIEGLAKLIARDLFELGDMVKNPTQRIQFMGGSLGNEIPLCGLCESALAERIAISIDKNLRLDMPKSQ